MSWNLLGLALPLVLGVVSTPLLLRGLGTNRFGILLLSWTFLGYFSLFDLGLGRALTQRVASRLGSTRLDDVPSLLSTSIALLLTSGCVGSAVMFMLAPWLNDHVIRPPDALQSEILNTLYLVGLSLPAVFAGSALRGLLEAVQRFDYVNAVRIPSGVLTYLGPLAVLPASKSLTAIVAVLVVGRIAACLAYYWLCLRALPPLRTRTSFRWDLASELLKFGGWMTASNLLIPVIAYFDRFAISASISVTAVAYYVTPFDTVTKLAIIPTAINFVLFPAFATTRGREPNMIAELISRGVRYAFLAAFPICLLLVAFAQELLSVWVGAEFARNSGLLAQVITIGVFANILTQTPLTLIQGVGRPDVIAKLFLAEFPLYAMVLILLLRSGGINGAAMAWTARSTIECAVAVLIARRVTGTSGDSLLWLAGSVALAGLAIFPFTAPLASRAVLAIAEFAIFSVAAWYWIARRERLHIGVWLRSIQSLRH